MGRINRRVNNYFSLVKFSHTVFALPFALIGSFLAIYAHGYGFKLIILLLVLLCMVLARNAAMGFNRLIDKDFDKLNPRTKNREIPNNIITTSSVKLFVIINSIGFVIATWFINPLCFFLSPIALAVILGYSYTKRFTWLCHIILGLGLSLAPVGAYIAFTSVFHLTAVLYSIVVLFWVAGFDIVYSINDKDFDRKNNLYSIPAAFGKQKSIVLASVFHVISAFTLIIISLLEGFGLIAYSGVIVFVLMLLAQNIWAIKTNFELNPNFFIINGLASIFLSAGIIVEMIVFYY